MNSLRLEKDSFSDGGQIVELRVVVLYSKNTNSIYKHLARPV
jgi:hypothetical protein